MYENYYCIYFCFDFGVYMGYNRFDAYPKPGTTENGFLSKKYGNTLYYGINTNFHVLPFFIKASDFRFDFYLTTKLGGFTYQTADNYIPENESFVDFSVGPGVAMYVFKNLGLFCEYTYNTNKISNGLNFRYGLCLKFNFKK